MKELICDASVVLKWFNREGEDDVEQALALLDAHREESLRIRVLDLTYYEIGNALIRKLGRTANQAADVLHYLRSLGPHLTLDRTDLELSATVSFKEGLSYYDACYVAKAINEGSQLVTADSQILDCGGGVTVKAAAENAAQMRNA